MSLIVEIKINDTLIARAVARNQSNLADVGDYVVDARLDESKFSPGEKHRGLEIKGHNRNQTVWSLVEKMMKVIQGQKKVYVLREYIEAGFNNWTEQHGIFDSRETAERRAIEMCPNKEARDYNFTIEELSLES